MNLSHYSNQPIEKIASKKQNFNNLYCGIGKPQGLWISVDGEYDWPSWCEEEEFLQIEEQYHYRVHIKKDANILHLKSTEEIKSFHEKYCAPKPMVKLFAIPWQIVAKDYDGIIISPYCQELRLDCEIGWYYPWDCASGCIWAADAIEKIELIREPMKEAA